jgi:methylenetetrahydrofolate dehydrogenase (NADP+)/methenyltetrahydrofolate cyclohydrolase
MIIDGKAIAAEILAQVYEQAKTLPTPPRLTAFVVAPTGATRSYLSIKRAQATKAGVSMDVRELPETIKTDELISVMRQTRTDGVIVQLPLPSHIDTTSVLEAIPVSRDADVLSPRTRSEGTLTHPIAASVREVLQAGNVTVAGAHAVVVGQGWLVGLPSANWLEAQGATVTRVTKESGNLEEALKGADIIVTGVGSPNLITPDMVPEGAVVIDAGTSELGGSISGDVDRGVAEKVRVFTPVPGGLGPIAVSFLMYNVVALARARLLTNESQEVH